MSEVYAFERAPYQRQLEVEILELGQEGTRLFALLDDTICYPEGGGQPADHGRLRDVRVVDVQRSGGDVRHFLESRVELGRASLELDWERRYDHMQQHTAQHLLSALALARFGWQTRSFHIGPTVSHIELGVPEPTEEQIEALEEMVASAIRESRWIRSFRVGRDQIGDLDVRSRGLPEGHSGDVRLVEIEGIDRNTCGGTHVGNTAEVEAVKTVGSESIRGGCRLSWVAGRRVRRRLAAHEARVSELRGLLDTGDDELAAVVRLRLEQLRQTRRDLRRLEARLAVALADRAAAGGAPLLRVHLGDAAASLVRSVAESLGERAGSRLALVTATDGPSSLFVLVAGVDSRVDLPSAGRRVAELLGGRGGGGERLFQGVADSLDRLDAAVSYLNRVVEDSD